MGWIRLYQRNTPSLGSWRSQYFRKRVCAWLWQVEVGKDSHPQNDLRELRDELGIQWPPGKALINDLSANTKSKDKICFPSEWGWASPTSGHFGMPGTWSHQRVWGELCLRLSLVYGKMSFGAWLCLSAEPLGHGYAGYSLQSSSCPQEQVSWFRASVWSSKVRPISFLHFLWARSPPPLKGQLLKRRPQLTWTLVPHPKKEAKKHMKCIWAGSRKRWQEMMWPFYGKTSSFIPPPKAETSHKSIDLPLSSLRKWLSS